MSTPPPEVQQQAEDANSLGPVIGILVTAVLAHMAAGATAEQAVQLAEVPVKTAEILAKIARRALFLQTKSASPRTRAAIFEFTEQGVGQAVKDGVAVLETALKHTAEKAMQKPTDSEQLPAIPQFENQATLSRRTAQTVRNSARISAATAANGTPDPTQPEAADPQNAVQPQEKLEFYKAWNSVQDGKTRMTHAFLGSKTYEYHSVPVTDPFITVNGDHLMFPGDPTAPLDEIAGCRCHATVYVK